MRIHNPFPLRRCSRKGSFWACALLIMPLGTRVQVPSDSVMTEDPLATTFTFGAGGGSYARDFELFLGTISGPECDSPPQRVTQNFIVESRYSDVGGAIDHQATQNFHVGARGGYVWERAEYNGEIPTNPLTNQPVPIPPGAEIEAGFYYINPYFAIEKSKIGFGAGFIYSSRRLRSGKTEEPDFSGNLEPDFDGSVEGTMHMRVGSKVYASYQLWEGVPIYSGGGMHTAGIGIRPHRAFDLWGGVTSGPYHNTGALIRLNISPSPSWTIHTNFRVLTTEGIGYFGAADEIGFSAALTYRIFR